MLTSFIGIDGKDYVMCNWNDLKIKFYLVVGAHLNTFLIYVYFILCLMTWLEVDFVQD